MGRLTDDPVDPVKWLYGVTAVVVFIMGSITNGTTLGYFLTKKGHIPNMLYTSITVTDLLICILILPVGLSLMGTQVDWLASNLACNIWGVAWTIGYQMSIFLVLVFSLCRTKVLLFPFSRTSKGVVKTIIIMYFIFVVFECGVLPYALDSRYSLHNDTFICIWDLGTVFSKDSRPYFFFYAFFNTVQRFIPFVVAIICCALSYVLLVFRKKVNGSSFFPCLSSCSKKDPTTLEFEPYDKHKTYATVTILLATSTYGVLNIPNILYMMLVTTEFIKPENNLLDFDEDNYFAIFALVMCMALHSMANPIVCFLRMQCLRNYCQVHFLKVTKIFQVCTKTGMGRYMSKRRSTTMEGATTDVVVSNPSRGVPTSEASVNQPQQTDASL